jgi:hypothetical protein
MQCNGIGKDLAPNSIMQKNTLLPLCYVESSLLNPFVKVIPKWVLIALLQQQQQQPPLLSSPQALTLI